MVVGVVTDLVVIPLLEPQNTLCLKFNVFCQYCVILCHSTWVAVVDMITVWKEKKIGSTKLSREGYRLLVGTDRIHRGWGGSRSEQVAREIGVHGAPASSPRRRRVGQTSAAPGDQELMWENYFGKVRTSFNTSETRRRVLGTPWRQGAGVG